MYVVTGKNINVNNVNIRIAFHIRSVDIEHTSHIHYHLIISNEDMWPLTRGGSYMMFYADEDCVNMLNHKFVDDGIHIMIPELRGDFDTTIWCFVEYPVPRDNVCENISIKRLKSLGVG